MTDRISHFTVGLAHDLRDDDIDAIVTALKMVKGVISVEPHVADYSAKLERMRFAADVRLKLFEAVTAALDE